ncbi:MAG: hypothetical protein IE909_13865, partial [Campylobacterales bacterium]|nr:hypothetical protein [Campylobacterales bacterium]
WEADKSQLLDAETIKSNFLTAMRDDDNYEKIITRGNSIENIKFRVDKFIEILTGAV